VINVLHLRDTDRVCGPGKTIIETARATDKREFSQVVGLFLRGKQATNVYMDAAVAKGVHVIPLRSAHPFDPRIVATLVRVVREHGIQIIHSHEYKSDILAYLVSLVHPVSIMTTVHGWIRNQLKSRMYVGVSQVVMRRFDRVVAVSDRTREAIVASGVDPAKIVVIRNGIVTENYQPHCYVPGAFRRAHGIPPEAPLVGYVGRLSPEKGQVDLLRATPAVLARHPDTRFVFVGDGPDQQRLAHAAAVAGVGNRVIFTGHLSDVLPVYRDLDVLALTSLTEGLPNVVLEALCMETAVLATDVGGTREIVRNGSTGVLVPAGAPDEIAAGLNHLLGDADRRRALAMNGKKFVHGQFDFSQRVAREESLYREILQDQRSRAMHVPTT
jgi:glycosyltransferase involved in cell wall biosynthesis